MKITKLTNRRHETIKYITTLFFFFVRTSNFGAEAECSLLFEPENVLNMFLKLCGTVLVQSCISLNQYGGDQETYQSALFAVMWYQVACHIGCAACFEAKSEDY